MNALVYGWTRGDFLSVMSAKRYNRGQKLLSSFSATCDVSEKEEEEEAENEGETNWKREGTLLHLHHHDREETGKEYCPHLVSTHCRLLYV